MAKSAQYYYLVFGRLFAPSVQLKYITQRFLFGVMVEKVRRHVSDIVLTYSITALYHVYVYCSHTDITWPILS